VAGVKSGVLSIRRQFRSSVFRFLQLLGFSRRTRDLWRMLVLVLVMRRAAATPATPSATATASASPSARGWRWWMMMVMDMVHAVILRWSPSLKPLRLLLRGSDEAIRGRTC
jgi:hypothetical protein